MITSYIRIAWRNLIAHKFNSILNILGLAVGIGFTLLILAYVWGELTVNKELKDHERQYIVQSRWKDPDMSLDITTVGPLVKQLHDSYPHLVADYYRWDGV